MLFWEGAWVMFSQWDSFVQRPGEGNSQDKGLEAGLGLATGIARARRVGGEGDGRCWASQVMLRIQGLSGHTEDSGAPQSY